MRGLPFTLALFLFIACRNAPAPSPCGVAVGDAGCVAGQYCSCAAGYVDVNEADYPCCRPNPDGGDPSVQLSSAGAPGFCEPCSYTAHCTGGHWDSAQCTCVPN